MQYDVATPADYLAALPDDWRRERLLAIRALIAELAPDWAESIGYKMLRYSDRAGAALHLNAQKHFVGLYVGDLDRLDPDGGILDGFDHGKGCIRIRRRDGTDLAGLRALLVRLVALRRDGAETGC